MDTTVRQNNRLSGVRKIAQIGVLSAMATLLMLIEFPLWFAPEFYKLDLSEVVVLIGGFAMGPLAAAEIELVKILLNFLLNGTITGGIGELANFIFGCSMVMPAALIYKYGRTKRNAIIGLGVGTAALIVISSLVNAFVLLPVYGRVFGLPIDALVRMGTAVNPGIVDLKTFVLFAVAPFNLLKGIISSVITMLLYKKVSPVLRAGRS